MNYNLKNRPSVVKYYPSKGHALDKIAEFALWFEGFEAELREMQSKIDLSDPYCCSKIFEEILGE